jgi:hypothetical protein
MGGWADLVGAHPARGRIRAVLAELGIGPEGLTRELYTEAVAAARRS